MNQFLYNQEAPFLRLSYMRISLSAIISILLIFGPYDSFYVDTAPWLYNRLAPLPNLGIHFLTLKYCTIALGIASALNLKRAMIRPLFAIAFLILNYYVTQFGTTYWITNTHLNFFTVALCFEPLCQQTKKEHEIASFIIAFMTTYIAVLYFQAGLSKVVHGHISWFLDGKRILHETLLLGTPIGKWLTQWPWIFQLFGIGTGVFELILPFGFFFKRTQVYVAATAILFHLSTFIVMGISFWFLWALFPGLFFYKWIREKELILVHQS